MVVARSRIASVATRLCDRFRNTSSVSDSQTAADCQRHAVADAMQRLEQSAQIAARNGVK
jgi:UrcA family protein